MNAIRIGWLVVMLLATTAWSADRPPTLRRVDVPADRPDLWPAAARTLVAVPRVEFEQLWQASQPRPAQPPQALLESAHYIGALEQPQTLSGRCTWRVVRHATQPVWLELSPCNLAIEHLAWTDRPAIWGADADGKLWLWVDAARGELTAEWTLTGQVVADETTFAVELPVALASTLSWDLPEDRRLTSDTAVVRSGGDSLAGRRSWEISLGSMSTGRLSITPASRPSPSRMVIYRRQQAASIREDHLRFQTTLVPEVLDGEVRELTLMVPSTVDVLSVTWSGDVSLPWTRTRTSDPRDPVTVTLPDWFSGELRPIRLEGITPQRPGAPTTIPDVEIQGGILRTGEVKVTVARPLQVAAVRATGCRQQAPVLSSGEGETYSFLQSRPESLLTFEVRRPRSMLMAQVLSAVTVSDEEWIQQSDVVWTSASGSAFQVALKLPAGWDVTDIDASSTTGETERISWERILEPDGTTRLAVELLEALNPESPRRLTVWSRRRPVEEGQAFECPAVRPLDCQSVDTVVAFRTRGRYWLMTDRDGTLTPVAPEQLPEAWKSLPLWSPLATGPNAADAWFHSARGDDLGTLVLDGRPPLVDADVSCLAEMASGVVSETFTVRVRAVQQGSCDRLLVFISEAGPDIAWEILEPAGLQLVARRLPTDRHALRDLPETGDLWELRLPPLPDPEIVIRGARAQPLSLPMRLGLAVLPQARAATYRISTQITEALSLQPLAQRLQDDPEVVSLASTDAGSTLRRQTWRYTDALGELSLVSRRHGFSEPPCLAQLELRSLLSSDREAYDLHGARCTLPAVERSIRLRVPETGELLMVTVDGERLEEWLGNAVVISPRSGTKQRRVELVYRTPQTEGFLFNRRSLVAPLSDDIVWTGVRWEFFLPPGCRLENEPQGIRLEQPLPRLPWTTRVFGPLGRSVTDSLFVPWSLAGWRDLVTAGPVPTGSAVSSSEFSLTPPADWQGYVGIAPTPADVLLTTWHEPRLHILAWLGLLGTLTAGVLLRVTGWGFRDQSTVVWLALLVGTTLTLEGPVSEIIGGLIAGTIIGVTLPRRWLGVRLPNVVSPPVPVGSTQSFRIPPGAATTSVLLLAVVGLNSRTPEAQERPLAAESMLLVPVDGDGQPSRLVPLVYVHPRTLEQLRTAIPEAEHAPGWLLQSADYQATATSGQRWPLTATLHVLICDDRERVTLPLKLAGASVVGPQSCLVDGQPAAVTVVQDSGDLELTWLRGPQPVSAIGAVVPTAHTITLRLQAPWRRLPGGTRLVLPIPAAACSRLTLTPTTAPVAGAAVPEAATLAPQSAVVGPAFAIDAGWSEAGGAVIPSATQIDVTEMWDVGATLIDVRSRTILRPRSGPSRRFVVDLPLDASLRAVRITPQGRWQRLLTGEHERQAAVEFAEPLGEPAIVEVDYVVPHESGNGEFQGRGLLWRSSETKVVLPQSRIWALAAAPDLRVEPQSLENSGLVPVSRAAVQEALAGLTGDRTPQVVYQVSGNGPVPFRWSTVTSRRRLLLWQQTGTLERDRLRWELEGDVEVQGAPVYAHVLFVDRRLRIDSITVRERGAERLVRWSETRLVGSPGTNRITLFLSDPCVETQRIAVTASMVYAPTMPLPLPNIRCEESELVGGRLLLSTPPELDVDWATARGLRGLESGRVPSGPVPASGVYDQTDPDWRAVLRVRPAAALEIPRVLCLAQAAGDDTVRLTLRCQIPFAPPMARGEGLVPAPWMLSAEPTPDQAVITADQRPDGVWALSAAPLAEAPLGGGTWSFVCARSALKSGILPLPRWLLQVPPEVWLVDLTSPPVEPLLDDALPAMQPPAWAAAWLGDLAPMAATSARWILIEPESSSVPLRKPNLAQSGSIAWLEHALWRQATGEIQGCSVVRLAEPRTVLSAAFPARCRFLAARVDGRDAVTTQKDATVRLAADDGAPFVEVWMYWDQKSEAVTAPVSSVAVAWPTFPGCSIGQQAVALYPAPGEFLSAGGGWASGDWVDRALLRLESLSDQFAAVSNPQTLRHLHREFQQGYALLADKLGRQPEVLERGGGQRATRWQAIVATTNRLREVPRNASARPMTGSFADALSDHGAARQGMVPPHAVQQSVWRIDRHWGRWLLRCVLVLLLLPGLRLIVRREWSEWLKQHPYAATALLGLVWWLCLSPSILGFALIVWSAVRAVSVQRPVTAAAA